VREQRLRLFRKSSTCQLKKEAPPHGKMERKTQKDGPRERLCKLSESKRVKKFMGLGWEIEQINITNKEACREYFDCL
jgi:hypothetical protein